MSDDQTALVEQVVRRALAYVAGIDESEILPSTSINGLGIESVGVAALRLVLEAEIGLQIPAEDVAKMVLADCVADVHAVVERILVQATPSVRDAL